MGHSITLYVGEHCPRCHMIKGLLDKKAVPYTLVSDMATVLQVAEINKCVNLPFAYIGDEFFTFAKLQEYIKNM